MTFGNNKLIEIQTTIETKKRNLKKKNILSISMKLINLIISIPLFDLYVKTEIKVGYL